MSIKSTTLHSSIKALLDSGATDNFIDPVIINRYIYIYLFIFEYSLLESPNCDMLHERLS